MAMVINTNALSLNAQNNLNKSQQSLNTAIERLSSGSRINSAKDDAAGLAISNRMNSQVTGLNQANRNANDGVSLAQTAEGALSQVTDNLQRIRELSVQAANGTNTESDLTSIQEEVTQRLTEINRLSEQTQFNGKTLLDADGKITLQVGANDNQTISIDLKKIDASTLGLEGFDVSQSQGKAELGKQVGYNDSLGKIYELKGDSTKFASMDKDGNLVAVKTADTADATNGGYEAIKGASGENLTYVYQANDAANNDYSNGTLTLAEKKDGKFYTQTDGGDAIADGATALETAKGNLGALDNALATVDSLRSSLGAVQNRLTSTVEGNATTSTNLSAAMSQIKDADYATEVSNMSKAQILQQAGTSVLAQANQTTQGVMSLLR